MPQQLKNVWKYISVQRKRLACCQTFTYIYIVEFQFCCVQTVHYIINTVQNLITTIKMQCRETGIARLFRHAETLCDGILVRAISLMNISRLMR